MSRALPVLLVLSACGGVPRDVTYYAHVQPLLQEHCTRCHQPDGLGVGDFTDPDVVLAFAERIQARAEAGTMPLPVADPECRPYVGAEHMTLDASEKKLLRRWVERGAPLGDPANAVDGHVPDEVITDADLTLTIPPYTPAFEDPGNPGNEYRCFALEHGRTEDFFVTALGPEIDASAIVHHIVVGAVPRDEVPDDAFEPGGVDCIDNDMGTVENMLAAWAPGSRPQVFEEGAGMRIAADDVVMMQMHYYASDPTAEPPTDASGYALRTAPAVDTELEVLELGSFAFRIPANDPAYTFEDLVPAPRDLRIHGVFPHMHVLGAAYRMEIEGRRDGCLVASDVYDFDNQLTYLFEEPVEVEAGERLRWACTWNNSRSNPDRIYEEPRETLYGERTDEEMCFFFAVVEGAG